MASWIDKLRQQDKRAKLAREMTHSQRAPIESLLGQDALTDWGIGVQQRVSSTFATLVGEAKRYSNLSPVDMGLELALELALEFAGGGMIGRLRKLAGKTKFKIAHEVAQRNAALPVSEGGLGLLPNNTAMARAKAMGFDTPAYHGRVMDDMVDGVIPSAKRGNTIGNMFATDNPNVSSSYAMTTTPNNTVENIKSAMEIDGYSPTNYPILIKQGKKLTDNNDIYDVIPVDELADNLSEYSSKLDMREFFDESEIKQISNEILDNFTPEYAGSSMNSNLSRLFGYIEDHPRYKDNLVGKFDSVNYQDLEAGGNTIVPFSHNQVRSRFAAFDPMQRNSANILAGGFVGAVGLSSLAGLYNQDRYE